MAWAQIAAVAAQVGLQYIQNRQEKKASKKDGEPSEKAQKKLTESIEKLQRNATQNAQKELEKAMLLYFNPSSGTQASSQQGLGEYLATLGKAFLPRPAA